MVVICMECNQFWFVHKYNEAGYSIHVTAGYNEVGSELEDVLLIKRGFKSSMWNEILNQLLPRQYSP